MKILGLASILLLAASGVNAQRVQRGGGHPPQQHETRGPSRGGEVRGDHGGHGGELRGRDHYDGRHFDGDFRNRYFGSGNIIAFEGPDFIVNGGFSYGGCWFGFTFWPDYWVYTDPIYIDVIGDDVFLLNGAYPGVSVGLSVVVQ